MYTNILSQDVVTYVANDNLAYKRNVGMLCINVSLYIDDNMHCAVNVKK